LLDSPPPFEESLEISDGDAILSEWHTQQARLKLIFEKQKSQGGIIDLSEIDRKRLVISSPRVAGGADSGSPSSSSDSGTGGDAELLVLDGAGGNAPPPPQAHIPSSKDCAATQPARTKAFHHPKEKSNSAAHHHVRSLSQQNGQVKQMVEGGKPASQTPQEAPVPPPGKTSPTFERYHHGHRREHGKGKGGRNGEGRRRYK